MFPNRFDPLAKRYDDHAAVAAEAGGRLLERLDGLRFEPASILDLGCATGRQSRCLRERFGSARIIAMDASARMLRQARRRRGWWRPRFELVRGDARALPLASASIDLVFANLVLNWTEDLDVVLAGLRRVLRPDGLLLVSLFGPDTLGSCGLRKSLTVRHLPDVQALGSALIAAGFSEPVLDTDWLTTTHSSAENLAAELYGSGLLAETDRIASPPGPQAVSWEIVSASAWAPPPGQPFRGSHGEEVSIPVERIGIRRRS
ncbi:MAG: methyltransferase domain-containing protein [Wenzhouxiangella sp.]